MEKLQMAYVLVATSRGDDLFGATKTVVMVSLNKEKLEKLILTRAEERNEWLSKNVVPYGAECSITEKEEVVEVPFTE